MFIKVKISGVILDPNTNSFIVLLKEENNNRDPLPIWVGRAEGNAINFALEGIIPPRPMTHDLIKNILNTLMIKIERVVVTDLRNNTYYANIFLNVKGTEIAVDSRPSDAIALATRVDAPIFVAEDVIKKRAEESLDRWLENLKPEDFGKYNA
ncbi:MAG: bifunctional nuclease family protein [Nitrospirae bacterium]|nr:bifunctional nuclease family protein [Nitrospirota bacterium]